MTCSDFANHAPGLVHTCIDCGILGFRAFHLVSRDTSGKRSFSSEGRSNGPWSGASDHKANGLVWHIMIPATSAWSNRVGHFQHVRLFCNPCLPNSVACRRSFLPSHLHVDGRRVISVKATSGRMSRKLFNEAGWTIPELVILPTCCTVSG